MISFEFCQFLQEHVRVNGTLQIPIINNNTMKQFHVHKIVHNWFSNRGNVLLPLFVECIRIQLKWSDVQMAQLNGKNSIVHIVLASNYMVNVRWKIEAQNNRMMKLRWINENTKQNNIIKCVQLRIVIALQLGCLHCFSPLSLLMHHISRPCRV